MSTDPGIEAPRGLATRATPSVVYGILGLLLWPIPIVGLAFGWMACFRAEQAAIELASDDRLDGRGLQRAGRITGIISMILGAASTVVWLVVLFVTVSGA